jgi:hypothetical protein
MLNNIYKSTGLRNWFGAPVTGGDYKVFVIGSPYSIPAGVQDGDFGYFLPSAPNALPDRAPIVYRYKAVVPVLPIGWQIGMWLPPEVYAGTPEVQAYAVGFEDQSQLTAQGFAITEVGNGLVTTSGDGFIRVQAPSDTIIFSQAFLTMPTLLGSDRFYLRCDLKNNYSGSGGSGFAQVGIVQSNTEVNTQYAFGRLLSSTNWRPEVWNETLSTWQNATTLATTMRNGGNVNPPFPSSTPPGTYWSYEVLGQSIDNLIDTTVNGLPMFSIRRNVDSAVAGDPMTLEVFAQGRSAGTITSQVDVRQLYILTW